jgi:hypothetical protein
MTKSNQEKIFLGPVRKKKGGANNFWYFYNGVM